MRAIIRVAIYILPAILVILWWMSQMIQAPPHSEPHEVEEMLKDIPRR